MPETDDETIIQKLVRLERENDFMRNRLAESDFDCIYCQLPKSELGMCASGFPGCARADDLFSCDELTRRDERMKHEGVTEFCAAVVASLEERYPPGTSAAVDELRQLIERNTQ